MTDLAPLRLGITYSPPTLVVELAAASGGLKHYSIRLRDLDRNMRAERLAYKLFARFPKYLDPSRVETAQVRGLLDRLLERYEDDAAAASTQHAATLRKDGDLNSASEFELRSAKEHMDVAFLRRRVDRDQPDFVYDKQQDFHADEDCDWDVDDDDDQNAD